VSFGGLLCSQTRVDTLHEEVSNIDGNVTPCVDAHNSQVCPTIISANKKNCVIIGQVGCDPMLDGSFVAFRLPMEDTSSSFGVGRSAKKPRQASYENYKEPPELDGIFV
jgi:hypothetical protein